jgi:hypothetical protein
MNEQSASGYIEMNAETSSGATPAPTIGLDLDGCIDEAPIFFGILTRVWPGKVVIITYRDDRAKAEADLAKYNIRYSDLVLVDRFDAKSEVIVQMGIAIYVDDQPEMLRNIPPTVAVLLFRNEGNFSYQEKLWMMSDRTGKLI